jgi:two-component system, NtrC family, sensor histidine kinase KinB
VVGQAADLVAAHGLQLKSELEPELPALRVDRQRIGHVFGNFIANAVKYSPPGGEILLRAARADGEGVEFSVTDHGPGIAEEYHVRIFDRFFRVPGQSRRGAGLGLSIAREIAAAHNGRVGVRSTPGQGSTFYVVLKAAAG